MRARKIHVTQGQYPTWQRDSSPWQHLNQLTTLDRCPGEVIQQFFNHSWHFIDTYNQKSHQWVGQQAMMSMNAMLNPIWLQIWFCLSKKGLIIYKKTGQKIDQPGKAWESLEKGVFGRFQPLWVWIWSPFVPKKSHSVSSHFTVFGCHALYVGSPLVRQSQYPTEGCRACASVISTPLGRALPAYPGFRWRWRIWVCLLTGSLWVGDDPSFATLDVTGPGCSKIDMSCAYATCSASWPWWPPELWQRMTTNSRERFLVTVPIMSWLGCSDRGLGCER